MNSLKVVLCGAPGIGKTTLTISQADKDIGLLYFDHLPNWRKLLGSIEYQLSISRFKFILFYFLHPDLGRSTTYYFETTRETKV